MKHSKKGNKPKGYSHGRNDNNRISRTGPIMIEDIMSEEDAHSKSDMTIREMIYRTDPTNEHSPVIKLKFKPLDNPKDLITVLAGILVIKQGIVGNNVTTGPLQYQYWRGCLTGTALARFNTYASNVGNETIANLNTVEKKLVENFAPREVLREQTRYMRLHMRKPKNTSTRQYVGAVATLNDTLAKLPPAFDATQKLSDIDILDIMASKAPPTHKDLLTEHGFNTQTGTTIQFVELCERAESKDAKRRPNQNESDDDDSDPNRRTKKARRKPKHRERTEFFCKEHGPNGSHNSKDCKVLLDTKRDTWKKKPHNSERYKDYKSKYQKKHAELNLLQNETKKEKAKWIKAYKKIHASSDSESSERTEPMRSDSVRESAQKGPEVYNVESSSSSSSDSESE
jgi:hypothetical protein